MISTITMRSPALVVGHANFEGKKDSWTGKLLFLSRSARRNPHSPETWGGSSCATTGEPTLVQDHVGGALAVSFRELEEEARKRLRKLGVLARRVRAPADMMAHLWEQVCMR